MEVPFDRTLRMIFRSLPENSFKFRIKYFYLLFWCSLYRRLRKYSRVLHPFAPPYFREYLWGHVPKEGEIVVDGGAFEGEFSFIASMLVGKKGKVIAFEPDRVNFRRLKEEIRRHNAGNVIALNKGLWSKNTTLKFHRAGCSSSLFFDEKNIPPESIKEVPVVRLDDELKKIGVAKVNFVKLDVEGAEVEVIKGAKEILEINDVRLAVASYHTVGGEKTHPKVEKTLSGLGYHAKTLNVSGPYTYGCPLREVNQRNSGCRF
jgi:FkbM family methyltransferase